MYIRKLIKDGEQTAFDETGSKWFEIYSNEM